MFDLIGFGADDYFYFPFYFLFVGFVHEKHEPILADKSNPGLPIKNTLLLIQRRSDR